MPPTPGSVTLLLPVKPYLKQFLTASFGPSLSLSSNHIVGIYVLVCLENRGHTGYSTLRVKQQMDTFTEHYPVTLPPTKFHLNGMVMRPHNIIFLNRVLDTFFDQQLYLHTQKNRLGAGQRYFGYNNSLRNFLSIHNIEEDHHITFEALVKREQRIKRKMHPELYPKKNPDNLLQHLSSPDQLSDCLVFVN